jgi:hypothetical protein
MIHTNKDDCGWSLEKYWTTHGGTNIHTNKDDCGWSLEKYWTTHGGTNKHTNRQTDKMMVGFIGGCLGRRGKW